MAVTVHDLTWWRWPETATWTGRHAYRPLLERALRRARVVITHTRAMAQMLGDELGISEERLHVVSPGIELPAPDPRWAPPVERYVLAVGTVEPRKNLEFLVEAFVRSGLPREGLGLVLVGRQGWGDLPAGVSLLSGLDDRQLAACYARSVGLVQPSLHEGFGLPVAEALALGRPVACSDDPVLREVSGDSAIYFDPRDTDDCARALRLLADVDGPLESAVERARSYTWRRTGEELRSAYSALLEGGSR
jgi:glycosyltransferase involved in cell wall biosynthesis